jgi:hypothetical protein
VAERERRPVMTTAASPMCMSCKRYEREEGVCTAYQDGIPTEIILGFRDHRVPQPGDNGLRYDPGEGAEPRAVVARRKTRPVMKVAGARAQEPRGKHAAARGAAG